MRQDSAVPLLVGAGSGMVRPPAVAGSFYPADPVALRQAVLGHLAWSQAAPIAGLKALLVPHAGYQYSGGLAGEAYASLYARQPRIERVVLLGPAHREAIKGVAVSGAASWHTPLGRVPVDAALRARLAQIPGCVVADSPHRAEHALEVQLPFLQLVLGAFQIVPILVGDASPALVAQVLAQVWGDERTLLILSTDLSHYQTDEQARARDARSLDVLLQMAGGLDGHDACGARLLNGFFLAARQRGLQAQSLGYRNSGDVTGDTQRVVGYGAVAYLEPERALGEVLLRCARSAIELRFGIPGGQVPAWGILQEAGASFVTLTQGGRLRGCIGTLSAYRPLLQDVLHNAQAAAFNDPRFPAMTPEEWSRTRVEVSWLSEPVRLEATDEASVLAQLRPQVDGVILSEGKHRATYLPQVWAQLPEPADFLRHLKEKAGLPPDYWSESVQIQRYTVRKWQEP